MKITLDCKSIPPGPNGNDRPRLLFAGAIWDEWDLQFCVHGEKLRWSCDACDEHFETHPEDSPNNQVERGSYGRPIIPQSDFLAWVENATVLDEPNNQADRCKP